MDDCDTIDGNLQDLITKIECRKKVTRKAASMLKINKTSISLFQVEADSPPKTVDSKIAINVSFG